MLVAFCATGAWSTSPLEYLVYVGTYTGQGSEGIYVYHFDVRTGALTRGALAAKMANPSFLAISPDEKFLYAVSEARGGAVSSFAIGAEGALTPVNSVSTKGPGPCFVTTDKTGRAVVIANYGGGSVASFQAGTDGRLSEAVSFFQHTGKSVNAQRQEGPHAHSVNISPDNRFAVVADLGLDELLVYKLNAAAGSITPNEPPYTKLTPGDGPRHFAFHPTGKLAFAIDELRSTVTPLKWDAKRGVLKPRAAVSTLPPDFKGDNSTAEIQVHPSGKWLYGSNRGHDSIAVFAVNQRTGALKRIENVPTRGSTPRNFRLDPSGQWLIAANQKGNSLTVFQVDPKTGRLTGKGEAVEISSPVCVKFVTVR